MTDTELFKDTVEFFAEDPERRSVVIEDGFESCRYRDDKGRKCAIGRFIPDDKYDPSFENACLPLSGVDSTPCQRLLRDALPAGINLRLLDRLQSWHDNKESFTDQYKALIKLSVALEYCLNGPDITVFIGTFDK